MVGAFLANSAIRCSLVETLSGLGVPCIFPSSGSVAPAPLSLHRVPRVGSPASQVRWRAPTSCRPSRRASLPSRVTYPRALVPFAPPPCRAHRSEAWTVCCIGCPTRWLDGDDRISQVPGEPPCVYAVLFDPGRASVPGDCGTSVLPPLRKPRRPPRAVSFRGSITRPARSLCTLRSRGCPRTTQHSVPAGRQPLPGGTVPPGSSVRFQSRSHMASSSPRLCLAHLPRKRCARRHLWPRCAGNVHIGWAMWVRGGGAAASNASADI